MTALAEPRSPSPPFPPEDAQAAGRTWIRLTPERRVEIARIRRAIWPVVRSPRTALGSGVVPLPAWTLVVVGEAWEASGAWLDRYEAGLRRRLDALDGVAHGGSIGARSA